MVSEDDEEDDEDDDEEDEEDEDSEDEEDEESEEEEIVVKGKKPKMMNGHAKKTPPVKAAPVKLQLQQRERQTKSSHSPLKPRPSHKLRLLNRKLLLARTPKRLQEEMKRRPQEEQVQRRPLKKSKKSSPSLPTYRRRLINSGTFSKAATN